MVGNTGFMKFVSTLQERPHAWARIRGSSEYPKLYGNVYFYQMRCGTLVAAEIAALPQPEGQCAAGIFGFHIHAGTQCAGKEDDPFGQALAHYDPHACPHPQHAGDMPPLFGNQGYGFQVFLTDRFSVREILGRTVILHSGPDDFTTQPAGNAGQKIACGQIRAWAGHSWKLTPAEQPEAPNGAAESDPPDSW